MEIAIHFGIPVAAVLFGAYTAWLRIGAKVKDHDDKLARLERSCEIVTGTATQAPIFIRRSECAHLHDSLNSVVDQLAKSVQGLQNYALWHLTSKEGLSLAQAKEIINGKE